MPRLPPVSVMTSAPAPPLIRVTAPSTVGVTEMLSLPAPPSTETEALAVNCAAVVATAELTSALPVIVMVCRPVPAEPSTVSSFTAAAAPSLALPTVRLFTPEPPSLMVAAAASPSAPKTAVKPAFTPEASTRLSLVRSFTLFSFTLLSEATVSVLSAVPLMSHTVAVFVAPTSLNAKFIVSTLLPVLLTPSIKTSRFVARATPALLNLKSTTSAAPVALARLKATLLKLTALPDTALSRPLPSNTTEVPDFIAVTLPKPAFWATASSLTSAALVRFRFVPVARASTSSTPCSLAAWLVPATVSTRRSLPAPRVNVSAAVRLPVTTTSLPLPVVTVWSRAAEAARFRNRLPVAPEALTVAIAVLRKPVPAALVPTLRFWLPAMVSVVRAPASTSPSTLALSAAVMFRVSMPLAVKSARSAATPAPSSFSCNASAAPATTVALKPTEVLALVSRMTTSTRFFKLLKVRVAASFEPALIRVLTPLASLRSSSTLLPLASMETISMPLSVGRVAGVAGSMAKSITAGAPTSWACSRSSAASVPVRRSPVLRVCSSLPVNWL